MAPRVFYKATTPAGRDFYSGTIDYAGALESGLPVEAPHVEDAMLCGPGMLHAATVPAETLIGGSWPCRLFEVTGRPVAGMDAEHPYKAGFKTLRVVAEIEAHRAFGPNGAEVVALIERVKVLSMDEEARLEAAWNAEWNAAWNAAGYAAGNAARNAARYAARYAAGNAAWDAAWNAAGDAAWNAARHAAWNAARNAAMALVVRDLISVEHFDVLYGPWASVMGAA